MNNLERLIASAVELGNVNAFIRMGMRSAEISQRQARDTYHKPFVEAVKAGRLKPCRVEEGKFGGKYYLVEDILKLIIYDSARAELKL